MECNKDEAIRAMDIAKRKVTENDYTGAKAFAIKAQNLYPQLDGLKQVLMLIDVYISAGNKITGGESDWYGVLGVDPLADEGVVKRQYRKLALLLHPDKNKCEGAEGAFKLVLEAWSLLSDKVKRIAFDQKRTSKEVKPRKSRKEKQPPKEQKQPAKQPKPPKQPKQPKQPKPPKEPKPPKQPKPPKEPKPPMQPQQPPMQPQQPENQQKQPPMQPRQPENQQKQPPKQPTEPPMQPQQPENQQKQPPMQPQQPENQQKQPPKQPRQPPMQPQQPENQQKQPPKQPRQPPMQPQQPPQQPQNQQRQPLIPQKQPQNQQKQAPSPQKQPQNQQKQAPSPHKQPKNQPSSNGSRNGRARSKKPTPKVSTFWTMCNKCGTQHEYVRVYYLNKTVLCRNCLVSFKATEKEKTPQETNENTRVASCGKDSLSRMTNQPEERVKRVVEELDEKDDEAARGIANSDFRRLKKLRTGGGAKASSGIKV